MSVYILWLRQLKRFWRAKSRIVGSVGQPLLFFLAFSFGFGPVFARAGAGNYMEFLAPGIIAQTILFTAIFSGIELIWDRQIGYLKAVLVAPVSRFKIMLGRTLGGATVAAAQGLIVMVIAMLVGFRPASWLSIPLAILFMILTAILFTAIGTAIASLLKDMHGFQLIMNFLVMPLFLLSGALFPLTGLPRFLAAIVRVDPLAYSVDGMRGVLIGQAHYGVMTDFAVLAVLVVAILSIGSYLFSKIEV